MGARISRAADKTMTADLFIGVNWGSTNLRALLMDGRSAKVLDQRNAPEGVAQLDQDGMADALHRLLADWPRDTDVLAGGMIGSTIGWTSAPYVQCPCEAGDLAAQLVRVRIGERDVAIVPGLSAIAPDGGPDVMRGEELEIFGLHALGLLSSGESLIALPGTHTKWARIQGGRVLQFFTSMASEVFDRVAERGVLADVLTEAGAAGPAFAEGLEKGAKEAFGFGRLLFSARAQVVTGAINRAAASSFVRGVLIGAELQDVERQFPGRLSAAPVALIGNSGLCALYHQALEHFRWRGVVVDPIAAVAAGFCVLRKHLKTVGRA